MRIVSDQLIVGTVIGDVVEDHQAVVQSDGEDERRFSSAKAHGLFTVVNVRKYIVSASRVASSYSGKPGICALGFLLFGL
jgi:hypothetical protein